MNKTVVASRRTQGRKGLSLVNRSRGAAFGFIGLGNRKNTARAAKEKFLIRLVNIYRAAASEFIRSNREARHGRTRPALRAEFS